MFILKFANRSHLIDDDSGARLRAALESGEKFVTISMDFSGVGAAIYRVTINTEHVHALIDRREQEAANVVSDLRLVRRAHDAALS